MKLLALIALGAVVMAAACTTNPAPPRLDGGAGGIAGGSIGAAGGAGGGAGAVYPPCPQHRVEGIECMAPTDAEAVLRKNGFICAVCSGVDSMGQPTAQPLDCRTVAGGDLCVASCGECS